MEALEPNPRCPRTGMLREIIAAAPSDRYRLYHRRDMVEVGRLYTEAGWDPEVVFRGLVDVLDQMVAEERGCELHMSVAQLRMFHRRMETYVKLRLLPSEDHEIPDMDSGYRTEAPWARRRAHIERRRAPQPRNGWRSCGRR